MVILWWFYGDNYGDSMVIIMVILWWFYGDSMVILWPKSRQNLEKKILRTHLSRPGFISWFSCVHVCRCTLEKLGSWWWCHGSRGPFWGGFSRSGMHQIPRKGTLRTGKTSQIRGQIEQNIWDTFQQTQSNIDMENTPCVDHVLRKKHMDFHRLSMHFRAKIRTQNFKMLKLN